MELEDETNPEPITVPFGQSKDITLPPLALKLGKATVLRFRAVIVTPGLGGCNWNAKVALNGDTLEETTDAGDRRLLGRESYLELVALGQGFPTYRDDRLMIMFAPNADAGDKATIDGQGATFCLDISDAARSVDGNTVTFHNLLASPTSSTKGDLVIQDISVGWVDRSKIPKPVITLPDRGPAGAGVKLGGLEVVQTKRGGFVLRSTNGLELLAETSLGMKPGPENSLLSEDGGSIPAGMKLTTEPWGKLGYALRSQWGDIEMTRHIELREGRLIWKELWRNAGQNMVGVPVTYRFFLRNDGADIHIAGSDKNPAAGSNPSNPTLFFTSSKQKGNGFGVAAESDWLRLLLGMKARQGVGEIYTRNLALAAGKSVEFELTLTPVTGGGGYWTFINELRRRWEIPPLTMQWPIFWGYAKAPNTRDPVEAKAKALKGLGPICLCIGPWQRLAPDAYVVRENRYPRLPEGAPRAPGKSPDLDVDAFLTFAHREQYWDSLKQEVDQIRAAAPEAKIIQMLHPAMEVVYKPLQDRWPIAADAIRVPSGEAMESAHYSKAWVGDMVERDWGVLYYVPRPGSAQLEANLAGMRRAMDELGLDGIYSDEFSFAFWSRGYSRYDYSRWDGYSADLGAEGKVSQLMADNGFITEPAQLQMLNEIASRGKFFLGNGGPALRSHTRFPHHRFVEGGNGSHTYASNHLAPVPLVLGNMGDTGTMQGVFESVRKCLQFGCVYSPMAVNLQLKGRDNFVCKLYPITVTELGPGWVVGRERIATIESRIFSWPHGGGKVKLYRYEASGNLMPETPIVSVTAGQTLKIQVPDKGLVVAESVGD